MAKRVLQADGTYCYTEGCRIHDRSLESSVGSTSVIADARFRAVEQVRDSIRISIKELAEGVTRNPFQNSDAVTRKLFHDNEPLSGTSIGNMLVDEATQDGINPISTGDAYKLYEAGRFAYGKIARDLIVTQGDQVILESTGQRGVVTEGSTAIGGRVRVAVEDRFAPNDFAWHEPKDVVKIQPATDENINYAREQIVAAPSDNYLPKESVYQLLDQETSVATRNPQALYDLTNEDQLTVREELMASAESFDKEFPRHQITKGRIFQFLQDEAGKERSWLQPEDAAKVKKAYQNVLNYISPKKI